MFKHICNIIDVSNLTEVSGTIKQNEAKHMLKHLNELSRNTYLLKDGKKLLSLCDSGDPGEQSFPFLLQV